MLFLVRRAPVLPSCLRVSTSPMGRASRERNPCLRTGVEGAALLLVDRPLADRDAGPSADAFLMPRTRLLAARTVSTMARSTPGLLGSGDSRAADRLRVIMGDARVSSSVIVVLAIGALSTVRQTRRLRGMGLLAPETNGTGSDAWSGFGERASGEPVR